MEAVVHLPPIICRSLTRTYHVHGDHPFALRKYSAGQLSLVHGSTENNPTLLASMFFVSRCMRYVLPAASSQAQLAKGSTGLVGFGFGDVETFVPIDASGVARISSQFIGVPPQLYTVTAGYGGDQTFGPSSSSAIVAVNSSTPATASLPSNLKLTCTPSVLIPPQTATCQAQLAYGATGNVSFLLSGNTTLVPIDPIGLATLPDQFVGAPDRVFPVTASYAGNVAFAGSNDTFTVTVGQQSPSGLTLSCTPNSVITGSGVNCTAQVIGATTGTVSFYLDGVAEGTVATSTGMATLPIPVSLAAGSYSVTASFDSGTGSTAVAPPFTITVTSGTPPPPPTGPVSYSYKIVQQDGTTSGYAANGNVTAYTDSINGTWGLGYDNVNRLISATQTPVNQSSEFSA